MTSRQRHFVGGLSIKKAESYYYTYKRLQAPNIEKNRFPAHKRKGSQHKKRKGSQHKKKRFPTDNVKGDEAQHSNNRGSIS